MGLDKHSFLKLSVELCYILFKGEDNAVEMKNDFVEKVIFPPRYYRNSGSQQGLLLFSKIDRHVISLIQLLDLQRNNITSKIADNTE